MCTACVCCQKVTTKPFKLTCHPVTQPTNPDRCIGAVCPRPVFWHLQRSWYFSHELYTRSNSNRMLSLMPCLPLGMFPSHPGRLSSVLARMVALKLISKVYRPTQWCTGMVVVLKKAGSVRICVDFRCLNECFEGNTPTSESWQHPNSATRCYRFQQDRNDLIVTC